MAQKRPGWLFPARTQDSKAAHLKVHSERASGLHASEAAWTSGSYPIFARHTFATTAMRETGNTFAVMRQMGHASVLSKAPLINISRPISLGEVK